MSPAATAGVVAPGAAPPLARRHAPPRAPLCTRWTASPSSHHGRRRPAPPPPAALPPAAAAAAAAPPPPAAAARDALAMPGAGVDQVNMVYKFGGSSVASAARMREVAEIVCAFPEHLPAVVLSAMGKTTNLLLAAGEAALAAGRPRAVPALPPLRAVKEAHRAAAAELGVDAATLEEVEGLLAELEQLLVGVAILQDLTPRARDSLVSFGERLSVRLFAAHLRARGVPARAVDAFDAGLWTSDAFTNAEVAYAEALPALRAALAIGPGAAPRALPVVTGFLGRGRATGAITTLGRGGSDLTCTLLGAALGLPEVQVWKDVDGVLTSDPRVVDAPRPVPLLTFEEATELATFGATVLHPLAMQPAQEHAGGAMGVRVKNSYNRGAPGTLITSARDMSAALVTSIVLKTDITLVDVVSTRATGAPGFLARVFAVFEAAGLSVDVVATSEVSVSATLDPTKAWERPGEGAGGDDAALDALVAALGDGGLARASHRRGCAILTLICNVARTCEILERAFRVLGREAVGVQMMSQGASKTNITLIVRDAQAAHAARALHAEFFGA